MEYHDPFWKRPPVIAIAIVFLGPLIFSLIKTMPSPSGGSTQSTSKSIDTTSAVYQLYQLEQDLANE